MSEPSAHRLSPLSTLIFVSRWMQLPLYLGLIIALGLYVALLFKELWYLIQHATEYTAQPIMLAVLSLIDVVMISYLLLMVIVGGYETFISRLHLEGHPDQPEWLSRVNASALSVNLSLAIIGISSIHLLKTFMVSSTLGTTDHDTANAVMWQTIIHCVFILSAVGTAYANKVMSTVRGPHSHP